MHSGEVFFPQRCSHLSCAFNALGELRVAMALADRLLFLKEGTLCACGPLFNDPGGEQVGSEKNTEAATLRQLRFCQFSDEIRVAVVGTNGVTVVDVSEGDMQLRHRRVVVESHLGTSTVKRCASSPFFSLASVSPQGAATSFSTPSWMSGWDASVRREEVRGAVDAEFTSVSSLAIVLGDRAVVVEIGADGDIVKWRSWGSYSTVAVCRTNLHLAFAVKSSAVEVFPRRVRRCQEAASSLPSLQEECDPSILFPPSHAKASFNGKDSKKCDKFALRGVLAKLGVYKVAAVEWHHIAAHTILCVTCQHPNDDQISIALFVVQFIPEVWKSRQKLGENNEADLTQRKESDHTFQLVPFGTVSFGSVSYSLRAQLVPSFCRSIHTKSLSNKLEFLCFENDGTVRSVCYRFGRQKLGGFPMQRSAGVKASKLLLPLQENYGNIVRVDVLPVWKFRAVELGAFTPQAEQLMRTRRYRLLTHFANGMVAKVMIDLLTMVIRVEAFLTLGVDPLPLCLSTSRGNDGEVLLLGISHERAFVIEQVTRDRGVAETTLLAVSPISVEHRQRMQGLQTCGVTTDTYDTVAVDEKKGEEEAVKLFVEAKCPEKARMIPSLMKACGGDAGKLLTRLAAKYGPIESTDAPHKGVHANDDPGSVLDAHTKLSSSASSSLLPLETGFRLQQVQFTAEGICCSTRHSINGREEWWCIPTTILENFSAVQSELVVPAARIPAIAPMRSLNAAPIEGRRHFEDKEVFCEWVESLKSITVRAKSLPDNPPLSFQPFENFPRYRVDEVKATRLVNRAVIVGVMGTIYGAETKRVLWLYGLDLLRNVAVPPMFFLELKMEDVLSFALSQNSTVFVLHRHKGVIDRWIRVATGGEDGFHWEGGPAHDEVSWRGEITAMAPLWAETKGPNKGEMQLEKLLFSSSDGSFIHAWNTPPAAPATFMQSRIDNFNTDSTVEIYHPTTLLVLLRMGRWRAVRVILEYVLQLACAMNADGASATEDINPSVLAREFCHNPVSIRLCERPSVAQGDLDATTFSAEVAIDIDLQIERLLEMDEKSDGPSVPDNGFTPEMLEKVMEQLSLAQLRGLSSQEQLGLVCVVDAIRAVCLFTIGMDVAASKFFFLHKLRQLWRRLGVRETFKNIIPHTHTAFLWAALSDAQPRLLHDLLNGNDGKGAVSWTDVEAAGVPFWLRSLQGLRTLAERVARGQYQATRDVRECALMYILAGKVGVLAALCKAERNAKLHAFFLRNFNESKNKTAAAGNGFAAVSKNMVAYGAAFFVLAGEFRNATQVLLQRHGSIALALLVLRLASNDNRDDLLWFVEQRVREEAEYGPMNVWEEACLLWHCGLTREARGLLSRHVPLCAVEAAEIVSFLRNERRRVRGEGLTPLRELLLLMHMTRLSHAKGMQLPAMMSCREAEALLAQVRGAKAEEHKAVAARITFATRTKADFNTGTLTFHGFGLDDEDADGGEHGNDSNNIHGFEKDALDAQVASTAVATSGMVYHEEEEDASQIDVISAVALERELEWAQSRLHDTIPADGLTEDLDGGRGTVHAFLVCTARMVADVGRHMPIARVENRLAFFLKSLLLLQNSRADPLSDEPLPLTMQGVVSRLLIVAVRLVLLSIAIQNTDYALANALLEFPTVVKVLREQNSETATLDSVLSYVRGLQGVLRRVRAMTMEQLKEDETGEVGAFSPFHELLNTGKDGGPLLWATMYEEKLRSLLILWSAAFLHLCALSELREEVGYIRGVFADLSHPPQYAKIMLWLLGCMLCRVTLAFNTAASQVVGHVVAVRQLDDSLLTNPNGIFIEEEQELRRVAELLESNLLFNIEDAATQHPVQTVLLDLCVAHAEFFWQFPSINAAISTDTDQVVLLLRDATQSHTTAHLLYGQLSDGAVATLRKMEVTWLRRVHTHAGFCEMMLEAALCGGLEQITTTDRLVLYQSHRAICSVDYDRSSCESLVWGTDAGAEVTHGYREILAGDNEAAFLREQPDRNFVTATLSAGLGREQGNGTAVGATQRDPKALSQRPRFSFASHAMVVSHPHLPFFLTRHCDGCVDLYSFTSNECVATFLCHGSHVVTDIAYSSTGYVFAAGLADGSVSGWRFNLGNSSNDPLFSHRLLPPGGVKVTLFFENQHSLLIVAGFDYAKEESSAATAPRGRRGGGGIFYNSRAGDRDQNVVGVILLVDLVVNGGAVLVRRELPFVPEHAVYMTGLDLVLCVAVDGRVLLFDIWKSHLYILGNAPPVSPCIAVSCVAVSHYDDVLAIGTQDGHALLLRFHTILEAKSSCLEEASCESTMATYVTGENVLYKASRLQIAPVLKSHSGVSCMVFAPSVLLAGLNDGKLVAAMLVPHALRQGGPLSQML
ncbi:putative RAVE protein 1 C terminal [Trypanosoma cruzi]|nr:putative RAVE protein 1 C terminal [Trypanosoma cruzi]